MWNNPLERQSFVLAAADGTVLAELPPTLHFDSSIGLPEPPAPPDPRPASTGSVVGTTTTTVAETTTPDYHTYERSPYSSVWFPLGDGLPKERPPAPSTVTTVTTTAGGKTVTQTVQKDAAVNGNQVTTTTTTATTVALSSTRKRYAVVAPYWGVTPGTPLLETNLLDAAYTSAYERQQAGQDAWVLEWDYDTGTFSVLEKFMRSEQPRINLTGQWIYRSGDEMLIHSAEIERACLHAAQLMFRGRVIAELTGQRAHLQYRTADRMRDVTYTLTLYTTEYFTAQEFMRRQLE